MRNGIVPTAGIVVVGDIDPDRIEAKIKEIFSQIATRSILQKRILSRVGYSWHYICHRKGQGDAI